MSALQDAVADLDEKRVLTEIRRRMGRGESADKILGEVQRGLHTVGERFEKKRYALIELGMADELFKECVKTIKEITGKPYPEHPVKTTGRRRRSRKTGTGRVD